MGTVRPTAVAAEEAFIAGLNANPMEPTLGIVVRETDRLIGVTGLAKTDVRQRHAMFGIGIGDKSAWGKGYGTEATRPPRGIRFRDTQPQPRLADGLRIQPAKRHPGL